MRPPEFTGGNRVIDGYITAATWYSFNEAAGIHRRKPIMVLVTLGILRRCSRLQ